MYRNIVTTAVVLTIYETLSYAVVGPLCCCMYTAVDYMPTNKKEPIKNVKGSHIGGRYYKIFLD